MSKVRRYVNNAALIESVADKQMVSEAEVLSIVDQLFECMIEELRNGHSIRFEKLGTFSPALTGKDVVFRTSKACRVKLARVKDEKAHSK